MTIIDAKVVARSGKETCPICSKDLILDGSVRVTLPSETPNQSHDIYVHSGDCYAKLRKKHGVNPFARLFGA